MKNLENLLNRIDGKSYNAYKDIKGRYDFKDYRLNIIRVQGDPFASPSLFSIEIDLKKYLYEKDLYKTSSRKLAFEDYMLRRFSKSVWERAGKKKGSGKSGLIAVYQPKQEILKRSAAEVEGDTLNIKFYLGLPAAGRRILAKAAIEMIFQDLPKITLCLKTENVGMNSLKNQIETNEIADYIRNEMEKQGIVSFVANESVLARVSSIDDRPMKQAVRFKSPENLEYTIELPNGKVMQGMAIKKGVTLITGGGFHGKSTLLNAIEKGVYNHIPGDGREFVLTDSSAFKIRAEDGRSIQNVDISNFINNLPFDKGTTSFYTENASGSTSQACNIMEAVESGSKLILIDEDTCATNFMVRDVKIHELISKDKEPITPFIEKINALKNTAGVSVIVVVGGLGDYFDVADSVLMLDEYRIKDVTKMAREVSARYKREHLKLDDNEFVVKYRALAEKPCRELLSDPRAKIKNRSLDELLLGREAVDLRSVEQLIEEGQVRFIGEVIKKFFKYEELKKMTFREVIDRFEKEMDQASISSYLGVKSGGLAFARKYEVAAAVNRVRKKIFTER